MVAGWLQSPSNFVAHGEIFPSRFLHQVLRSNLNTATYKITDLGTSLAGEFGERRCAMKQFLVFVGILLFGFVSIANGDSIRCGSRVVSTGDSKIEVISKCGPPDDSETVSYDTKGSISDSGSFSATTKKVDKLYYNCGEGRFIEVLIFMDGKLVKIERGGYGSGPEKCN
jgi:hypothetical protein